MLTLNKEIAVHLGVDPFTTLMTMPGEIYRKQPTRETLRVFIGQAPYFIKRHRGLSVGEYLKNIVVGKWPVNGASQEVKAIQLVSALGIPTTPLMGHGQRGYNPFTRKSFLLTGALDHTVSLEKYCEAWAVATPDFNTKLSIITEVARISRLLHQNHCYHKDYYLCHFLLQLSLDDKLDKQQPLTLHLIDLHRMHQSRTPSKRWLEKDLAGLLFSALDAKISLRDVLRFMTVYTGDSVRDILEQRHRWKSVLDKAFALYVKSHGREPNQLWMYVGAEKTARTRKIYGEMVCRTRLHYRLCAKRDFSRLYLQTLLKYPSAYFNSHATYLKAGDSTTVVRAKLGEHEVVIKRYNMKHWTVFFKRLLGGSKAAHAWRMSLEVAKLGVATPEPLAMLEQRWGLLPRTSYYVMRHVPGQRLDDLIRSERTDLPITKIAQALKVLMGALREGQYAHGDMKASNLIWDQGRLFLLDCDGAGIINHPVAFAKAHEKDWQRLLKNWPPTHPLHQALEQARGCSASESCEL